MKIKNFGALLVESAMIIFSVLISFYIESWRQQRSDHRKELEYLARIIKDLRSDSLRLVPTLKHFENVEKKTAEFLGNYDSWDGGKKLPFSNDSIAMMINLIYRPREPFAPASPAYSSLKSNGELDLIQDTSLADRIIEYYERTLERAIMQDYNELIKSEVVPYFGPNMDLQDIVRVVQKKFGQTKSDYFKLCSTNQTKSCFVLMWSKSRTVNRYLPQRLDAIKELSELIKKELKK